MKAIRHSGRLVEIADPFEAGIDPRLLTPEHSSEDEQFSFPLGDIFVASERFQYTLLTFTWIHHRHPLQPIRNLRMNLQTLLLA